ncbi:glycosyltransferase family 4 protein [Hansschlegelia quercus]|uniref:Glycosyltransferase n=1 Tax=Hansschlegelia quercus TaxID=2528245 RepID=A0A4Q9G9E9_9HYPH|nr:glycosyltransferase family 4 protein [Hansschlegelia quercus]TBN47316.1 glycosyltransferase [Hansschlegelia quercus]
MSGSFVVSQLGARMHYGVPRILHAEGRLEHLYTDICAAHGWPRALQSLPQGLLPRSIRRLTGRVPVGVPENRITGLAALGLGFALRRARTNDPTKLTEAHIWAGQSLSRRVLRSLMRDKSSKATAVYGFSGECLELVSGAKALGMKTVVEQIVAPKPILDRLVLEEEERFPGWSPISARDGLSADYAARERGEWDAANLILCGSDFVRAGVIACGGSPDRCVVVPYGVQETTPKPPRRGARPLRVLTIGGVGLRKGSPYVLEAARRMKGMAEFRMAGALDVSDAARNRLSEAVTLLGAVPRSEIAAHYAWADVFLLPSVCEGSATVIYEALMAGLPVVTTPNAGSVVRQGVDGYVTPIRDIDAIEAALLALAHDRDLFFHMARNARRRGREHSLEQYARRLMQALDGPARGLVDLRPVAAFA